MLPVQSKEEKKHELFKDTAYAKKLYLEESDLNNIKNFAVNRYYFVYNAALDQDEKTLDGIIQNKVGINVHKGLQTPIQQLAWEGEEDAVNLLINQFYGDMNEAVFGAEKAGDLDLAENLIERGASIDFAVRGAAFHGNIARVEALLKRGAHPSDALYGEGLGGHIWKESKKFPGISAGKWYENEAFLEESLKKINKPHCQLVTKLLAQKAKLKYFYLGIAQGNHFNLIKYLRQQRFYYDRHSSGFNHMSDYQFKCEKYAMIGACDAGNIGLYNYLSSYYQPDTKHSFCSYIAPDLFYAAGRSGDFKFAIYFLKWCYRFELIDGLLCGGFYDAYTVLFKKNEYKQDFLKKSLASSTKRHGENHTYIKNVIEGGQFQILNLLSKEVSQNKLICNLTKNAYFANNKIALQSLSRIHHEGLRIKIARAANKTSLLFAAKRIAKLMSENHFSYEKNLRIIIPTELNQDEMKKVSEEIPFAKRKMDLLHDLQSKFLESGTLFPDFRFKKLLTQCEEVVSESKIKEVLENAKREAKREDRYTQCISGYLCYFNNIPVTDQSIGETMKITLP